MNSLRRLFHTTALLGLAALGSRALGQTQSFVPKTKTINAAVLLLDADKPSGNFSGTSQPYAYGQTAAPYAFYNLDRATGIKPDGWNFNNPYAPGLFTPDILSRYAERYANGTLPGNAPSVGNPVTKSEGAFWEVSLSKLSESQIGTYNILLVAPRYYLSLNPRERELLRRFVDGGGVLWVDLGSAASQGSVDASNNLPFAVGSYLDTAIGAYRNAQSGVLDAVRAVTDYDLAQLNQTQPDTASSSTSYRLGAVPNNSVNVVGLNAEFSRYRQVVNLADGNSVVNEARVGDGAIVVTARGAAEILNRAAKRPGPYSNGGNAAIYTGNSNPPEYSNLGFQTNAPAPRFDAQARAAAKLGLNIVTLGGDGLQPSGSARKSSSAGADTPAPVLSRFSTEKPAGSSAIGYGPIVPNGGGQIPFNVAPNAAPVVYKGFLIATVGNQIVVMDAIPGRDLDGDGDPDDGISDANGNTVAGYRDASIGQPLDVIWTATVSGATRLSAPVCASIPEAGTSPTGQNQADQILVTDETGRLHVFLLNVQDRNSRYRLVGGVHTEFYLPLDPPANTGTHDQNDRNSVDRQFTPIPPVVYDGLAYVADSTSGTGGNPSQGRVWVVDLQQGKRLASPPPLGVGGNDWYLGTSLGLPSFTAEPTIGYIPIGDNSGGVDRVMYTPGVFTTLTQPGFASIWLGAKGEVPDSYAVTGGLLNITTRAAAAGGINVYFQNTYPSAVAAQLAPHLTVVKPNGDLDDPAKYVTGISNQSAGVISYTLSASSPYTTTEQFQASGLTFRIDYTIDWGANPTTPSPQIVRGSIRLPVCRTPTQDQNKRIIGPIALTARGTLHMIEATPITGATNLAAGVTATNAGSDSYFAMREDAGLRGQFRVVSRYTLYNQYVQTFGGSPNGTTVPAVFEDADLVQSYIRQAFASDPNFYRFTNFRFVGGVSVRNGIAYAAIDAKRGTVGIDVAMVAAFQAEPATPEIKLGQGVPTNPWIMQTDWARSNPRALVRTPTTTTLSGNSVTVDTDNGVIRFDNLATVVNGEIQDCLSLSQPIGVGSSTQTLTFRQPDAVGDRWSPLLWFGLWNGVRATGTPFVGNNEVYLPAQTLLPAIFAGTVDFTKPDSSESGVVFSIDGDSPTSGSYVTTLSLQNFATAGVTVPTAITLGDRPWINQQVQLVSGTGGGQSVVASPYYRMPQNVGIATFNDYKARLNQTRLGGSTDVYGLGGGEGIVTADGNRVDPVTSAEGGGGVFALTRADIVLCDEGRLLQVDSSGNPVQNTFGAQFSGVGGGGSVSNQRSVPRPVKAYPVGTSDNLVVDAGGNRIMRLGSDGTVLRSVERIQLDPTYKPTAFRVGEPLTLKDPRDATTFEGYVYKGAQEAVTAQHSVEYWIRYLVADSGNGRLVELADRFEVDAQGNVGPPITRYPGSNGFPDPNGKLIQVADSETGLVNTTPVAQVGVLTWQSPSLEGAANAGDYYNSVCRIFLGDATNGRYIYIAGVSRNRPTSVSAGLDSPSGAKSLAAGGGGAVVVFDPTGGTHVFDRIRLDATPGATQFQPDALYSTTGTFTTNLNPPAQGSRPFRGVQSVTAAPYVANNQIYARVMVTDEDAVYEFLMPSNTLASTSSTDPLPVSWMISEAAFTALRSTLNASTNEYDVRDNPLSFRPTYARRLDSGEVILVNGYTGLMRDRATAYTGEVTLLDGFGYVTTATTDPSTRNLGFTFDNVRLSLRTLNGIRGLVAPVFADRR